MRQVASFLLCCVALTAGAAEIWRWKDASGAVHYSDQPRPGAERISIGQPAPASTPNMAEPGFTDGAEPGEPGGEGDSEARQQPFAYTACTVASPAGNETFRGVQPVDVVLDVQPGLQSGHSVRVLYDNAPVAGWPADATRYTISEVFRGSHTLSARILDENGRTVCASSAITFHLHQDSILPPAGQAPRPRPAPRPAPGG